MTVLLQFLSILFLACLSPAASATEQNTLHMQRLRFNLPEVTTYLTLVEGNGTPISGKNEGDFKLLLDGERIESALKLTTFAQLSEPIFVVLVVKLTATTDKEFEELRKDIRQLAQAVAAAPKSRIGLISYAAGVKHLVKLQPSDRVLSELTKLTSEPPSSEAQIGDAMRLAIDTLRLEEAATRKLVVLFSDGKEETYHKGDFVNLGEHAEQAGIVIDTIYYGSTDSSRPHKMSELSKRSYGVERYVHSAAEGSRKIADLIKEINEQYAVSFSPVFSAPSHRFQVMLAGEIPTRGQVIEAKIPTFGNPAPLPRPQTRDWRLWGMLTGMLLLAAVFVLGYIFLWRSRRSHRAS